LHLPAQDLAGYDNYAGVIRKSVYLKFKPKHAPPWTVGYSESFSGNTWRQLIQSTLKTRIAQMQKAGLVKKLVFMDSNGDNAKQAQQMRSMIQQGVDIIYTIAGSPTALNSVIADAYKDGIPVVTIASAVTTPYAINLDANYLHLGQQMALGLVSSLRGKGNIVMVSGIKGAPGSLAYDTGASPIFEACPDIKMLFHVYGEWNNATAKTQMLQALATTPGDIDGIWTQGAMQKGVIGAMEQSGRSMNIVFTCDMEADFVAYWHDHLPGFQGIGHVQPPRADMNAAFEVGMRVMKGYGLKVNTIVPSAPIVSTNGKGAAGLKAYWKPSYTFETNDIAESPHGTFLNNAFLNNFFVVKKSVTPGA
jgi:ribose transport system substrate-binding protein